MEFYVIDEHNREVFEDYLRQSKEAASGEGDRLYHLSVYEEGEPVGAITLELCDKIAQIVNIYIRKEYRRQGFGRGLISSVCIFLFSKGYMSLNASFKRTVNNNTGDASEDIYGDILFNFFERCGFLLGNEDEIKKNDVTEYSVLAVKLFV